MGAFISCTRYLYYMKDLFGDEWIEVPEKCFDDCVVRFRNLYEMHYENHAKVFYLIESGEPEFKCVPVGVRYVEV